MRVAVASPYGMLARCTIDAYPQAKAGWVDQKNNDRTTADDRFEPGKQP